MLGGKIIYMSATTDKRRTNTLSLSTWLTNLMVSSSTLRRLNSSFSLFWTSHWCCSFTSLSWSLVVLRHSCFWCRRYLSFRQKFTFNWSLKTTSQCEWYYSCVTKIRKKKIPNPNPSTYLRFLFSLCSCRSSDSKLLKEILSLSTDSCKSILCVWRKLMSRNICWLRYFSFSMEHLYFQNTFITSTLPGVSVKMWMGAQCTWKSVHFCTLGLKASLKHEG